MCMQQINKSILWVFLLASSLQVSWAFSLAGPVGNGGDSWQVQNIGYGPPSDLVAPKNLGEGYRRNIPVMYYTYDANFYDYFGAEGAASVDAAFAILNSLTNVDQYSSQLSEFPLSARQFNYQAQALQLYDLKSSTLSLMLEQLGLAGSVQYIWTLHWRILPPGGQCPQDEQYWVVQRNFDYFSTPLNQLQYSPYINNTLYNYFIIEVCQNSPVLAQTIPFSDDPLASTRLPVASMSAGFGGYFTGLSRDDMAGLRYLLRTNNINWESAPSGSVLELITTNTALPQSFPPSGFAFTSSTNATGTNAFGFYYFSGDTNGGYGYGDLAAFLGFISTNDQAAVQAAYPGVIVSSVTSSNVLATNRTYSYSYTIPKGSSYGADPVLTVTTNYNYYFQPYYTYRFYNVFTNHVYTNTAKLVNVTVGPAIGSPYGSPVTTNTTTTYTNVFGGDFFVLPPFQTNVCPLDIIGSTSNLLVYTNYLTVTDTNFVTSTNTVNLSNTTYSLNYFTNYTFSINPVTCSEPDTNAPGLYQGIGNIKFVRADYDSLLSQYFQPITNYYTMVMVTNSQAVRQTFRRVVTTPDFLFSAEDILVPIGSTVANEVYDRNLNFDESFTLPNLAGPGTIIPSTRIAFNKVGPVFFNSPSTGMDGTPYFDQSPLGMLDPFYSDYFVWGSYDGTTNAPIVFPNGTSIDNLENQVLIQVSPTSPLPDGSVDVTYYPPPYQIKFTATGGAFTQPYTWSATNLPGGLMLSTDGTLSGTPTQAGTFDFTLKLTDAVGRSVQWLYTITIQP